MSPGCTLQVPSGVHLLSSPSPHAWYPFVSQAFLATAGSFDDIAFGIATAAEVAAEFSASVPAVILFKKFDEGRVDFTGAYTAEELSTFVSSNALPLVVAFTQEVRVRVLHVVKHQAVCVCVCASVPVLAGMCSRPTVCSALLSPATPAAPSPCLSLPRPPPRSLAAS